MVYALLISFEMTLNISVNLSKDMNSYAQKALSEANTID